MKEEKVRLLFVCLGNICRSPSAEAVMKRLVKDAGLGDRIEIDSAGKEVTDKNYQDTWAGSSDRDRFRRDHRVS